MADPKEPSDTGTVIADANDAFPDCPPGATQPCSPPARKAPGKVRRCVTQIKATTGGTKGVRNVNGKVPERPDNVLKPSGKSDKSFETNKPVVLIRGCKDVMLEATTTPPDTAVAWSVEANHTQNSPPEIASNGNKATLKTNVDGSFSVIATLDGCKVVWNVIFVWVKVDVKSSKGPKSKNLYADNGSSPSNFRFRSGKFSAGDYAWEDQLNVTLIGGGDDQKAGVEKVNLHVLQNGTTDTLTAHYAPPPAVSTALEKPPGGIPALDATNDKSPFLTDDDTFKLLSGSKGDVSFTIWTGDSPGSAFDKTHQFTKKALTSVSGVYAFDTAIASTSDDAPNAIVIHAHTTWTADFSGAANASGDYVPRGAKTTPTAPWSLISDSTGGQDAEAGDHKMETMGRSFNDNLIPDFDWTPSK
jgi:hypothetical protein